MRQDDFERGMEKEQIVLQGMETVLRMLETLVKAKKYPDQQMEGFRALLKYAGQGGEIRCDVIEPEEFEIFRELLEEHMVAYGATVFKDAEGEERVNVMYKDEDEGRMRVVRTEFMQKKVERFMEPEEPQMEKEKVQGQAQMQDEVQKRERDRVRGEAQKQERDWVQGEVQKQERGRIRGEAQKGEQGQVQGGAQKQVQEQVQGGVQKREREQEQAQGRNVNTSRNWVASAVRDKEREKQESMRR